jgi:hypothetical protein
MCENNQVTKEEKFPNQYAEELKSAARLEETLPETDACADCAAARKKSGDPTDLCAEHLKRIYGI